MMPSLYVSWRQPGPRVRAVIIIIIYLGAFRFVPHEAVALALGGTLGGFLAAEPARPLRVSGVAGSAR
jgi:hypothetical protein